MINQKRIVPRGTIRLFVYRLKLMTDGRWLTVKLFYVEQLSAKLYE